MTSPLVRIRGRLGRHTRDVATLPRDAATAWRVDGWHGVWTELANRSVYRVVRRGQALVFARDLSRFREVPPPAGVTIARVEEQDWPALDRITTGLTRARFARARARGRTCLAAWYGGRPVGYVWVSERLDSDIETFEVVPLPADAVYAWDVFVVRAARNLGVGSALVSAAMCFARDHGYRESWRMTAPGNRRSLRTLHKTAGTGTRLVGELRYLKIGPRIHARYTPAAGVGAELAGESPTAVPEPAQVAPTATAPYPPGPRGPWLLGTSYQWRRDMLGTMSRMTREYGDAVRYRFFGDFHGWLFTHPDHLRHILQDNYKNYLKGHPAYLIMRPFIGKGLLTNDGPAWLRQRRLMAPAFHRERIAAMGTLMTDAAQVMLERWAVASANGRVVDIEREMARLTLTIVGKALFGHDLGSAVDEALPAFTAIGRRVASLWVRPLGWQSLRLPFLPGTRTYRRNIARLDAIIGVLVDRRRAAGAAGDDLLGMLLDARDEVTGEAMTAVELRDEIMTLMFAGHETSAQALTWTFFLLSQHPEVDARLRRELADVLEGRVPMVDDLPALVYTRQVVQESLRIYPPVYAFPRLAHAADEVGGWRVDPNAMITLSPYLTHRHPAFWPDPERFDPERFTPERIAERPRHAFIPFSSGPRQCIGNGFALTEIQLVLATVLQRYRLQLLPGHPVRPMPMIALRPSHGLPMIVAPAPSLRVGTAKVGA